VQIYIVPTAREILFSRTFGGQNYHFLEQITQWLKVINLATRYVWYLFNVWPIIDIFYHTASSSSPLAIWSTVIFYHTASSSSLLAIWSTVIFYHTASSSSLLAIWSTVIFYHTASSSSLLAIWSTVIFYHTASSSSLLAIWSTVLFKF